MLQLDGINGATPTVSHRYLWGPSVDHLIADEDAPAGTVDWALTDHLGSVRDWIDDSGAITEHVAYDSFGNIIDIDIDPSTGNVTVSPGTTDHLFAFTGRMFDNETGLQNNLHRWYDPKIGRWISEDPIGFGAGDANLYRYVGNEPTGWIDPSGLLGAPPGLLMTDAMTVFTNLWEMFKFWDNDEVAEDFNNQRETGAGLVEATTVTLGAAIGDRVGICKGVYGAEGFDEEGNKLSKLERAKRCGLASIELGATTAGLKVGAGKLRAPNRPLGLPAPRPTAQVLQKDLDHIIARHWPTSGARGAGKFADGTTGKSLLDMVKDGVGKGTSRPNTRNRPGTIFEHDFGRQIGTDISGNPATRIRVVVRPDGTVVTAFPY